MMDRNLAQLRATLPFKSPAVALLLSLFFGPVGLLYASVTGGVVMILLGAMVVKSMLVLPILFVWVSSCVWSASAVNQYNQKLLTSYLEK